MENTNKRYWKGLEELRNDSEFVKNAAEEFPGIHDDFEPTHRRDFLKYVGFGMAAVSLAACEAPVRNAISYINKPVDIEPGVPNWYASTFVNGGEALPILVKTREGRPVKIEGNKDAALTGGGLNARAHASILSLYDNARLQGPTKGGAATDWATLDKEVTAALASIAAANGAIRLVTGSIVSPTAQSVINGFLAKYPSASQVVVDAISASGIIEANNTSFGQSVIPSYDFSKAKVMVGINADFLGTWLTPTVFSRQWAATRKLSSDKKGANTMSRHYQFESGMTSTGASADYRGTVKPSQEGQLIAALYAKLTGGSAASINTETDKLIAKAAADLKAAGADSIVVSGSNDANVQIIVNAINASLGNIGNTINFGSPLATKQGTDAAVNTFVSELTSGVVKGLLFIGSNPVYSHAQGDKIAEAIAKVPFSVSLADRADETASLCKYVAPSSHFLESWGDAEPSRGNLSLIQPTISTVFKTRQSEESLLMWSGNGSDYYTYLKNNWSSNFLGQTSWETALHNGTLPSSATVSGASFSGDVKSAINASNSSSNSEGLEVHFYESVAMGDGSQANNPWLLELPDPVSKVTWENYIAISPKDAKTAGVAQGDWANLTVNGKTIELPILEQPGQTEGVVSVALGYGRTKAGKAAEGAGANAFPLVSLIGGKAQYFAKGAKLVKTKGNYTLGQTQTHNTVMGRKAVVQESVLKTYLKNQEAGRFKPMVHTSDGLQKPYQITLWNGHEKKNHSWGMVVDLNLCNGCGGCVVSCNSENNIAVVGKKEVARAREMHWMRIDRYYSSSGSIEDVKSLETAAENPEVVFQPMMCQHCSNAPCETVCPVLATTHSSEGLNQMTYNRCVGTRYCANNCPYKVRRFNWFKYFENDNFDYNLNNDLGRMALNPDVTLRSRGVIEKCSMCVQRIQAGKLEAKKDRRVLGANEIQTACSQSCPTGAITFGDMNNPESDISKILVTEKEGRAFHMLEEINVQPQVSYLTKIRNKDEEDASEATSAQHVDHAAAGHRAAEHAGH